MLAQMMAPSDEAQISLAGVLPSNLSSRHGALWRDRPSKASFHRFVLHY